MTTHKIRGSKKLPLQRWPFLVLLLVATIHVLPNIHVYIFKVTSLAISNNFCSDIWIKNARNTYHCNTQNYKTLYFYNFWQEKISLNLHIDYDGIKLYRNEEHVPALQYLQLQTVFIITKIKKIIYYLLRIITTLLVLTKRI